MATRTDTTAPSRLHNIPDAVLTDLLGKADAVAKAAEAEVSALQAEARARARGAALLIGDHYEVTVTEQIAGRTDTAALKTHLGADYIRFEMPVISTVVRIKAVERAPAVELSGSLAAYRAPPRRGQVPRLARRASRLNPPRPALAGPLSFYPPQDHNHAEHRAPGSRHRLAHRPSASPHDHRRRVPSARRPPRPRRAPPDGARPRARRGQPAPTRDSAQERPALRAVRPGFFLFEGGRADA